MELSKIFSNNLVRYRTERGLSQKELAERSGISQRMVAHYETQVSKPSLDKISILADALGITVFQLLSIEEDSNEDTAFISSTDPRTLKQFKKFLTLSSADRTIIHKIVDAMLTKSQGK